MGKQGLGKKDVDGQALDRCQDPCTSEKNKVHGERKEQYTDAWDTWDYPVCVACGGRCKAGIVSPQNQLWLNTIYCVFKEIQRVKPPSVDCERIIQPMVVSIWCFLCPAPSRYIQFSLLVLPLFPQCKLEKWLGSPGSVLLRSAGNVCASHRSVAMAHRCCEVQ